MAKFGVMNLESDRSLETHEFVSKEQIKSNRHYIMSEKTEDVDPTTFLAGTGIKGSGIILHDQSKPLP